MVSNGKKYEITVGGSDFYTGSTGTGNVQYNMTDMVQKMGPAGSNATLNAEWTIIKNYVENSRAFTYDATTGNYTINSNDQCDK